MDLEIITFTPKDKEKIKDFVKFPSGLYKGDSNYISPMKMDLISDKLLGTQGLLCEDHPFHDHAEVRYFLAQNNGKILGRISCCIDNDYNSYHKTNTGSFGFFEVVEDYDIAKRLLDEAVNWLKEKGVSEVMGPMNFSSNHTVGLLIEGFDHFPFMDTPYNKQYYAFFLEDYGFKKEKDMIAQMMSVKKTEETEKRHKRLEKIMNRIKRSKNITTRSIDLKKGFTDEIKLMRRIYLDAWSSNWGFVPVTEEEMLHSAENMKIVADPGLVLFAYVDGELAGFIGSIPDVNEMIGPDMKNKWTSNLYRIAKIFLNRRKTKRVRLMLFGMLKEYQKIGVDAVLYYESFKSAHESGNYEECEISWLLEDNILVIRGGESMGGKKYKTWRVYSLSL